MPLGPGTSRLAALGLAALLAAGHGCAPAQPPGGLSPEDRFAWAQERFDDGKYREAMNGLRDFMLRDPLNPLADSAHYLLAESHLRVGEEVTAASEFQQLALTRPNSRLADDAQLGSCRAYWRASPKLPLEQESTHKAVEACNQLLQFFPDSPLRPEAEALIDQAQAKLAAKSYRVAMHYYDAGFYESANIYLEKALSEAPNGPQVAEILAILYRSYRAVGFDSEAEAVRRRLLAEHPDAPQARALQRDSTGPDG